MCDRVKVAQRQRYDFILSAAAIAAMWQCSHRSQRFLKGVIEVYLDVVHNPANLRAGLAVAKTNN